LSNCRRMLLVCSGQDWRDKVAAGSRSFLIARINSCLQFTIFCRHRLVCAIFGTNTPQLNRGCLQVYEVKYISRSCLIARINSCLQSTIFCRHRLVCAIFGTLRLMTNLSSYSFVFIRVNSWLSSVYQSVFF